MFTTGSRLRIAFALAVALQAVPSTASAQSPSLEGNWTGGGYAEAISGHRERVSCRVRYTREGADVFGVHAVCASQSVKLVQTGTVSRAGANRFVGDFYNAGNAVVQRDYETALKWYQKAREQGVKFPKPVTRAPIPPK